MYSNENRRRLQKVINAKMYTKNVFFKKKYI